MKDLFHPKYRNSIGIRWILFLASFFLLISFESIGQTIDFTMSATSICSGGTVVFNDISTGITNPATYSWNFGAGANPATGTGKNSHSVIYTYAGTSTVTITLSVTDANGTYGTSKTLTVNPLPLVTGTTPSSRCGAGSLTISATADAGSTIDWYSAASAGTLLLSDNTNYLTPSLTVSTTYYAQARNTTTGCISATRTAVVATINTNPLAPAAGNSSRCGTGTVTISATPGTGETIDWYDGATSGNLLASGSTTYTTPSISSTTTYYAQSRNTATGCTSATRTAVTATVNQSPVAPVAINGSRCGTGTVALGVAVPGGNTADWYDAEINGNLLSAGNTGYTTPSISTTTTYYAETRNLTTGCLSTTRTAVTATVNALPAAPVAGNSSRCGAGTVTLTATPEAGSTIDWYSAASGGAPILSNNSSYTTPSITTTTTYYAQARNTTTGCISATRTAVVAAINSIPSAPAAGNSSRCGAGTVTISATPGSGETIDWYDASSSGTLLLSGSISYTTPSISSNTSYYAQARNSTTGCLSLTRTQVTATINTEPASPAAVNGSNCGAGAVTIGATVATGNTVDWYDSATGGTLLLATSASYTTPSINSTTTYYAETRNLATGCRSAARTAVTATINSLPSAPVAGNSSRCGTGPVTLIATTEAGSTIDWYSAVTGGTPLLSNSTTYTTPSISTTTTYYAQSRNTTSGCLSTTRTAVVATINTTLPVSLTVAASSNPACIGSSVTFTATAVNGGSAPVYQWILNGANVGTGTSTYTSSSLVTGDQVSCTVTSDLTCATGNPATSNIITMSVSSAVGTPVFASGTSSVRCQGAATVTYTATAVNSVGISYSLDAASLNAGNSIAASTGAVTYTAGWSGTTVITATATGCSGPASSSHTVTVTPLVTTPVFAAGTNSVRCQGAGIITYNATASNTTGITYSLDAASLNGGNLIEPTTGVVNFAAGWSGTTVITASAAGCNGPATATHTVTTAAIVGMPAVPVPSASIICQGSANTYYSTTAVNGAAGYYWTISGTGNSISGTGLTGTVTWAPGFSGTATVTVAAEGCGGPSAPASTTVVVRPTPTASVNGSASVCQNTASPNITFANPQDLPVMVTYNVNGSNQSTIAVPANATASIPAPTSVAGTFVYNIVSVDYQTAPICSNTTVTGSATVRIYPAPAPVLTSTDADNNICAGTSVTFTAQGGGTNFNFRVAGISRQNGTSNTFTTSTLTNGQQVDVVVTNANNCTTTSAPITILVSPLPYFFISTPPTCSANLRNYSLSIQVLATGSTVTSSSGTVAYAGNNLWNISGIPSGTNITVTVSDGSCENYLAVSAPNCSCPPVAAPVSGGDRSYCEGGTVPAINASVQSGETIDWYANASGGTPLRSGSLSYTPPGAGTYYAQTRNITTNCTSSTRTAISVTVNSLPVATLVSSDSDNSFCAGTIVTFTAGGGTTYSFRVQGVDVQTGAATTYTTATLTNGQSVDVVVTNANGCAASSNPIINTVNAIPVANPGTGGVECDLNFAFHAVAGIGTGTWSRATGPGTATFTPNANSPAATVTVSTYGTYTFTWTEVNAGCSSSATITVTFNQPPVSNPGTGGNNCGTQAQLHAVPSIGTGTWTRTSGPGTATFAPNPNTPDANVTVTEFGQYVFTWTEVNGTCSNSAPVTINFIRIPAANAGPDGSECDLDFQLNAVTGAGTGTWAKVSGPGNATFNPSRSQPTARVTVDQFGVYEFSWTEVSSTCQSVDLVRVTFHAPPQVNAGRDTTICQGQSLQLAATGTGSFHWAPDSLVNNPGIANPVATPRLTTSFVVELTDQYGCKNTDTIKVSVSDKPVANAGPDQVLDYVFSTTMKAVLGNSTDSGVWTRLEGTGIIASVTAPNTAVSSLSLKANKFLWTVTNGVCPLSTDTLKITVNDFKVPTLITPNMDGKNDYFVLGGLSTLGKTEIIIFDRRGKKVYDNPNYDNRWDGVDYNNNPLPDDTYYYVLRSANGQSLSGFIVIRR